MFGDICMLGSSSVNEDGVALWQCVTPVTDETSDTDSDGSVDVLQCLGVSSAPYPVDKTGHAEGLKLEGCGSRNAVIIGGRDTRNAKIVGNLKPGDTVVHSTGPQQAAQLQLKEAKRQAVLATKDSNGDTMALVLDGINNKFSLAVLGHVLEITEDGLTFTHASGKQSIIVGASQINLVGTIVLGGGTPNPMMCVMLGPQTGSPGGVASLPLLAAPGVFVGL